MEIRSPIRLASACCVVFLGLLTLSDASHAHSKTDIITLTNGDDVTGEIKGLLQGRLSFSTDSMGTVQVEWEDVVGVKSDFDYEVRLVNGVRYYGSIADAAEPGTVRVVAEDGEYVVAVLDVVELRELEESVADRFDIRLGLGYSYSKAADVGSFTLTSELSYQDKRGVTGLKGRTSRTDQVGENVSSNRYTLSRQFWTRRPQVVRWLDGSYEDNDELDLDYRYTLGFGLGKAFVDNNKQSLIGFVGFQGASERSLEQASFNSVEGVLGGNYALWRFDTPEIELAFNITAYPGITESGRWRGNSDIRLSWELVEDFFWDISAWATYDNQSQSGTDTDYGVTTGLGWTY